MDHNKDFRWLFYVANAPQFGGGHVSRSLQLAKALRNFCPVEFYLDDCSRKWQNFLKLHRFEVVSEPNCNSYNALWLDHYDPNIKMLERSGLPIAGIMDAIPSELIYDFTVSYTPHSRSGVYGFEYTLIDPKYREISKISSSKTRYTICFGQTDSKKATSQIVEYFENLRDAVSIHVICGKYNTQVDDIKKFSVASKHDVKIWYSPPDLCDVFKETDVLISSGGVTVLEACAANIACVAIATADNQIAQIEALHECGIILGLDSMDKLSPDVFCAALETFEPTLLSSQPLIDGRGAQRLAQALLEWNGEYRD